MSCSTWSATRGWIRVPAEERGARLGVAHTVALHGVRAHPVRVEANIGPGLPGMRVVGLGDASVRESRERIRTAVTNSGLGWPRTKIVVSLSPACLPKSGGHFDLAITAAILGAAWEGDRARHARTALGSTLLLGEVALDGSLRPVRGVLPALLCARRRGMTRAVVPPGNAREAVLASRLTVLIAPTLRDAARWLAGEAALRGPEPDDPGGEEPAPGDFADIAGQRRAVRAAQVAAAGGHHLMLLGPPGSGKSMIAARMPTILPPLTREQTMEATAVHSVAADSFRGPVRRAPFVAPHHSVTGAGLLGGGSGIPRPGAVSLAHHGLLFLDEASEIPASVLDGLRTPLDEGRVRLVRSHRSYVFPARFQLVLAANPCRCAASEPSLCRCGARERAAYLSNISGPLRDRIDIVARTHAAGARLRTGFAPASAELAEAVAQAWDRARYRWQKEGLAPPRNADIPGPLLRKEFPASDEAMALIEAYLARGEVSQRGADRLLRIAWTLADLEGRKRPGMGEIAEALELGAAGWEEP